MMGEPRWKTNRPRPRFVNKLQLLPKMLYGNIASLPIQLVKMHITQHVTQHVTQQVNMHVTKHVNMHVLTCMF